MPVATHPRDQALKDPMNYNPAGTERPDVSGGGILDPLRVMPKGAPLPKTAPLLDASVRERWNDYGIGLLLQGDLKGAEAAFLKVTQMEPGYADGWVNVGRARLTEGNLAGVTARLDHARDLGATVVWLMPIHPIGVEKRKGTYGSPYSIRDYLAVNPDYGTAEDLRTLVREAHARGLKVIMDVVANHTSWDSVMMATPEYYVRDAQGRVQPPNADWTDVAKLDYANPKTRAYMTDTMAYWLRDFGVDGFRCDVAGLVPTDFWEEARPALEAVRPDLFMLAEWSTPDLLARAFDADYAWPLHAALTKVLQGNAHVLLDDASAMEAWREDPYVSSHRVRSVLCAPIRHRGQVLGLFYLETGAAQRASKIIYDRSHSAIRESRPEDYDWEVICSGKDWFHFSGTAPALGENVQRVLEDGLKAVLFGQDPAVERNGCVRTQRRELALLDDVQECGLQLIGDFYTSLVATDEMPVYFTFKPPTNDACLACHRNDWATDAARLKRIPHPAHLRVDTETRDCVKCHKWTAHFEGYIEKHKTMPFSGVCVAYGCHVGTKQTPQCFNCHHILHADAAQWKVAHPKVVRATGENPCLESCHTVAQCQECHTTGKTPKFTGMRIEVGMAAIETLHVKPDWTQRYHGPEALKDVSKCLLCHQTKGYCDECHLLRPAFHDAVNDLLGSDSSRTAVHARR